MINGRYDKILHRFSISNQTMPLAAGRLLESSCMIPGEDQAPLPADQTHVSKVFYFLSPIATANFFRGQPIDRSTRFFGA